MLKKITASALMRKFGKSTSLISHLIFLMSFLSLLNFCFFYTNSQAKPISVTERQIDIKHTAHQWANALASREPSQMIELYDNHFYLYATFENEISTQSALLAYFKKLMAKPDLHVQFERENIRIYDNIAINSGLYTFFYRDSSGKMVKVPARYTFVYKNSLSGWLIIDHHSSVLPKLN